MSCFILQINEYVPCNTNGREKNHFWGILCPSLKSKNPNQVYQSSLESLQRFSYLPPDSRRRVFIYFRRFGPLNNLDSCEVDAQVRQAAAELTAARFSLEKLTGYCEQSLPTTAHLSARLVINNLSWSMMPI